MSHESEKWSSKMEKQELLFTSHDMIVYSEIQLNVFSPINYFQRRIHQLSKTQELKASMS